MDDSQYDSYANPKPTPVGQNNAPTPGAGGLDVEEIKHVYGLIDHLGNRSTVKRIAQEYLAGPSQRLHTLWPVINPLVRPAKHRWRERQLAAWILGHTQFDQEQRRFAVETLSKILARKMEVEPAERRVNAMWPALLLSVFFGFGVAPDDAPGFAVAIGAFSCFFPLSVAAYTVRDRVVSSIIQAEAARSLGKLGATESLDVVVASIRNVGRRRNKRARRVRQEALQALPTILNKITDQQYGQYPSETLQTLHRLLHGCEEELALAILHALYHIGDETSLHDIERLAGGGGRASREPRVQMAAQACLPVIQTRVARERDPYVLLRAGIEPQTPPEQLLRAATEITPMDKIELLRASIDPNWKGTEAEISLVIRILQDLQQQGDTRAIGYIEQIADTPTVDARIRSAAEFCLPTLRAHAELEHFSPTHRPDQMQELRAHG